MAFIVPKDVQSEKDKFQGGTEYKTKEENKLTCPGITIDCRCEDEKKKNVWNWSDILVSTRRR
jgi:hypothetical protein